MHKPVGLIVGQGRPLPFSKKSLRLQNIVLKIEQERLILCLQFDSGRPHSTAPIENGVAFFMDIATLLLFCIVLVACLVLHIEIFYALLIGLILFIGYALLRRFSVKEVLSMCIEGIFTARNVLLIFFLIGLMTAFWRASGTIAFIVSCAGSLIHPAIFLLLTFVLNSIVSTLTGTAFGTSATMGLICATIGEAMQYPPMLLGGAVLAGAFFGDRSSPMSSSALLVADITHTDVFDNVKHMAKAAIAPYLVACALYTVLGFFTPYEPVQVDLSQVFGQEFRLHWISLLPAVAVLGLSIFRVPVKRTMLLSTLCAVLICVFLQGTTGTEVVSYIIRGYEAETPEVAQMLNGGGLFSMMYATIIVCLSSAYSGIFRKTGLLDGIQNRIVYLSEKVTPYGAILFTPLLVGVLSCNQTLNVMLTKQLCESTVPDRQKLALYLENTAIVISAIIPWSIACTVPLTTINAPGKSIVFAFFLYLTPLFGLVVALQQEAKSTNRRDKQQHPYKKRKHRGTDVPRCFLCNGREKKRRTVNRPVGRRRFTCSG